MKLTEQQADKLYEALVEMEELVALTAGAQDNTGIDPKVLAGISKRLQKAKTPTLRLTNEEKEALYQTIALLTERDPFKSYTEEVAQGIVADYDILKSITI